MRLDVLATLDIRSDSRPFEFISKSEREVLRGQPHSSHFPGLCGKRVKTSIPLWALSVQ